MPAPTKKRNSFAFYTIRDWNEMLSQRIADVQREGKWIVLVLENGIRIKFRDWSTSQ